MAEPFLAQDGAAELNIDGIGALPGPWMTFSGGGRTSTPIKIKPGHRLPEEVRPGTPTTADIVMTAEYKLETWKRYTQALNAAMDRGARAHATRIYLDARGNAFEVGDTYTGVMVGLQFPEYDANSEAAGVITITIGADGSVA